MRITITGNPDNQTLLVMASEGKQVVYVSEHEPSESIGDVMRKVRETKRLDLPQASEA